MTDLKSQVQNALGDFYRLEDELTGGGMSRLFIATEVSLNRRVVVKVLPPDWASEVSAARFKREMEVAARLQHPHILPVLAAGARTGLLYYIMPYVEGESLRVRMKRDGAMPVADARRILVEIADALAFAHEQGVIHRDIKPENILLEGRHAVLADFGVARALVEARAGSERLTSTGSSVGTPGYMSPEQVAGDVIDARADVYALAVVGYEMLAGRPPFTGPTPQAILRAHMADTPEPLRTVRPDCPASIEAAIARALSKDPSERFGGASGFLGAMGGHEEHEQGRPRPALSGRALAVAVTAAILVAAIGFGISSARNTRAIVERATTAAAEQRLDEVHRILDSAGVDLGSRAFASLAAQVAGRIQLDSLPEGMSAYVTRVHPIAEFPQRTPRLLGSTPLEKFLVAGEYLVSAVSADARDTIERIVIVPRGTTVSVTGNRGLDAAGSPESRASGFVRIPAGPSPGGRALQAYEIGRYEVTNAEYQRFVDAGGYRNAALWPDSMYLGSRWRSRAAALATFTDRSGLPGPRVWSGGKHPRDQERHPVVAVSWYEARAYSTWAGARLPTSDEWWRAALGDDSRPFPWGSDGITVEQRANFGLAGPHPVGSMRLGVSPFGIHDMAGNVREWVADAPTALRRVVVGGSWQDPTYMFEPQHAERFDPGYASPAIGFRVVRTVE